MLTLNYLQVNVLIYLINNLINISAYLFFIRYEDSVGILGSSRVSWGRRAASLAITVASSQRKSPESEPPRCRCSLHWLHLSPHSTIWTRSTGSSTIADWFSNSCNVTIFPPSLITLNIFAARDSCCFPLISAELEIQLTHSRNCIKCFIAMIKLFRPEKKEIKERKHRNCLRATLLALAWISETTKSHFYISKVQSRTTNIPKASTELLLKKETLLWLRAIGLPPHYTRCPSLTLSGTQWSHQ